MKESKKPALLKRLFGRNKEAPVDPAGKKEKPKPESLPKPITKGEPSMVVHNGMTFERKKVGWINVEKPDFVIRVTTPMGQTLEDLLKLKVEELGGGAPILNEGEAGIDSSTPIHPEPEKQSKEKVSTDNKLDQLLPSLPEEVRESIMRTLESIDDDIRYWEERGADDTVQDKKEAKRKIQSDPIGFYTEKITSDREYIEYVESDRYLGEDKDQSKARAQEAIEFFENIISALKTAEVESAETEEEIENLSPEAKKGLFDTLNTIGFVVEKNKNTLFAAFLNKAKDKFPNAKGWGGTVHRFSKELAKSFEKDAKIADAKIAEIQKGEKKGLWNKRGNVFALVSNITKYGRTIGDLTGLTGALPRRYVMMSAMAVNRISKAGTEARLQNEESKKRTRIGREIAWIDGIRETLTAEDEADIDRAHDEAIALYEKAGGQFGKEENIPTIEDIKEAYLRNMPKEIEKRTFQNSNILKTFFGLQVELSLAYLNTKIEKIYRDDTKSLEEKKLEEMKVLKSWENNLLDYERMVSQEGVVDVFAGIGKYVGTASEGVKIFMTLDSIAQFIHHGYELIHGHSNLPESTSSGKLAKKGIKALGNRAESPATTPSPLGQHPEVAQANIGTNPSVQTEVTATPPAGSAHEAVAGATSTPAEQAQSAAKKVAEKIAETPATPTPEVSHVVNLDQDVVQKGEGIESAFIRQIEQNTEMAKALGYKEGTEDLHKFAGRIAHRIALENGYVNGTTGEEIYVKNAGEAAYKLIPDANTGHVSVQEFHKEGTEFVPQKLHHPGDTFEEKPDTYEMRHTRTVLPSVKTPEVTTTQPEGVAYDLNRPINQVEIQQNLEKLGFTGDPNNEDEVFEYLKNIGYNNPGDVLKASELRQTIEDTLDQAHGPDLLDPNYDHSSLDAVEERMNAHAEAAKQIKQVVESVVTSPNTISASKINLDNLNFLFEKHPKGIAEFATIQNQRVGSVLKNPFTTNTNSGVEIIKPYLQKLIRVTGLKPRDSWLWGHESVQQYIGRALKKAEKIGKLTELNMKR